MRIEITETEITAGVRHALQTTLGLNLEGKNFTVDYSMGRGKNGLTGVASITDPSVVQAAPATKEPVIVKGFNDGTEPAEEAITNGVKAEVIETPAETVDAATNVDPAPVMADENIFGDDD